MKQAALNLRKDITDSEKAIWSRLRRKQIRGVQFYRQKPIGHYIVDFYAPVPELVVEVDGSQHLEVEHVEQDQERDKFLTGKGLTVLRFHNLQVFHELDAVVEVVFNVLAEFGGENPP